MMRDSREATAAESSASVKLQVLASPNLASWLAEQQVSLGFSTYQAGKLFLLGRSSSDRVSVFERTFNRCMGLWSDGQTLWMSSEYQLWQFRDMGSPSAPDSGFDRLYVPKVGYTTGDLDIHDLAVDKSGNVVFANTSFSCLATLSDKYSFQPVWIPRFISKLAAEDRCHLNGLALEEGQPRYVTVCGQTDVAAGWREHRVGGGCILGVSTGEVVLKNLSMPHSPRLHMGKLWLLDSGTGYFGYIDRQRGQFEAVSFCPGYARGLTFVGNYAVVGLSKPRREKAFAGLPLESHMNQRNVSPQCGLQVIDLQSGTEVHWLRLEGTVEELYDVVVLPGVMRPKVLGFKTEEIRHNVWFEQDGKPHHWSVISDVNSNSPN
jgi:uncharacterized protein (TIGR03032 family)